MNAPQGILLVDKPAGPTSHDIVSRVRRALRTKRVGHTGTLDPFASGLLVICVGQATRVAEYLSGMDKRYVATAHLGVGTDTLDLDGRVVSTSEGWRNLDRATLEAALATFRGRQEQIPPQYSAKKVGGEAMHRKARRGEQVELAPRPVTIHEISLSEVDLPLVEFELRCGSGTYVRSVARDLGERLGVGAHLTALRRTTVGSMSVDDAVHADALDDAEAVAAAWVPLAEALGHLPVVAVGADEVADLSHGRAVDVAVDAGEAEVAVALHHGELVAVGGLSGRRFSPRKVLVKP
ncbi:MAG: tRNA pseudouridine(55) synthase TruB [Gemmatimonadota bacterium]|nr:tRNA pseudouridine(55) synthase TruB [Gemmatimonadota bacterium]MDH5760245.1 tRNA pseudouridine(55) synthase TruB [Gemmatimonadota bacterium]